MARVWVVGSLNVDRPWRVERHPDVGETVMGTSLAPVPGGKGLNQAVAAARLGAEVVLVGCVGDDDDGRWLVEVARAEGIDVRCVRSDADRGTGTALIVVGRDGSNTVTVDPGANAGLALAEPLGIEAADVVVAQLEIPVAAVERALLEAREVGATSILNPSPVGPGRTLVDLARVVVVNETEADDLAPGHAAADPTDRAQRQAAEIALPGQVAIVTLGAAGAVAVGESDLTAQPVVVGGLDDVVAIDTTGAGDCFLGALAAGVAVGLSFPEALDRANRAAAISVTRAGTVPAMPTAAEVDARRA